MYDRLWIDLREKTQHGVRDGTAQLTQVTAQAEVEVLDHETILVPVILAHATQVVDWHVGVTLTHVQQHVAMADLTQHGMQAGLLGQRYRMPGITAWNTDLGLEHSGDFDKIVQRSPLLFELESRRVIGLQPADQGGEERFDVKVKG